MRHWVLFPGMQEQFAHVGELDLCYETFGDSADPAMLLVMGLGTQMLGWHEDFCRELAAEVLVPAEHLGAETHHQQHGRVGRITECLVTEVELPDVRELLLHAGEQYPVAHFRTAWG